MNKKQTEPYISRYLHSRGVKLGLPIGGNFELTARCNFNCPMCYVHLPQDDVAAAGGELSAAQWLHIAEQARDSGMVFALLTGGEPFVRKDFFEIYGGMKEMGIFLSINSNGSLLHGPMLERLLADPPFRVNVSLYGGSAETYCKMCGGPYYERVVENVAALKNAGVDVRLNLSITPYNKDDLADIYARAVELGVHVKAASYMYPSIRVNGGLYGECDRLPPDRAARCAVEWDCLRFTPEEFARRAVNLHALAADGERECSVDVDEGVRCRAGRSSFWLTWDGRMLPCGMMPGPVAHPLEEGFAAAWEKIRKGTAEIRMPEKCTSCPEREVCGVCAAVCVTETGGYERAPEYMCRHTRELVRCTWEKYLERTGGGNENK